MMKPELLLPLTEESASLYALTYVQQLQLTEYQARAENLEKRLDQYTQAYEQLQFQVKELLRHRFGQKSLHRISTPITAVSDESTSREQGQHIS